MSIGIEFAERGILPDWLVRYGIRRLLAARLRTEARLGCEGLNRADRELLDQLRQSPIAVHVEAANQQHYEVPADYFGLVLGPHRKYSACLWPAKVSELAHAEEAMLEVTCQRAQIENGMEILELGCGWGSLSLWLAGRFPASRILAISNSASQREFITAQAGKRGLDNLCVATCDINDFRSEHSFDRVVSVEMFEHLRNYELLFRRIARCLKPRGKLFAHVFYHGRCAYPFETDGQNDWMARHFFTGGLMPSPDLFLAFQEDLLFEDRWLMSGVHYQKTLENWLVRHDLSRRHIIKLFRSAYGEDLAGRMFHRWRIFYLACAELFGYRNGQEWGVAHFLFTKREGA
jgi:cyclopropane-fatty-acyl-phospholipid synthase